MPFADRLLSLREYTHAVLGIYDDTVILSSSACRVFSRHLKNSRSLLYLENDVFRALNNDETWTECEMTAVKGFRIISTCIGRRVLSLYLPFSNENLCNNNNNTRLGYSTRCVTVKNRNLANLAYASTRREMLTGTITPYFRFSL